MKIDQIVPYAWPGGYPLVYLDRENCILCAECARKEHEDIMAYAIHYEGAPLYCEECNKEIESAYGEEE